MTGTPIDMARAGARDALGALATGDCIEVIAFDSNPTRIVPMQTLAAKDPLASSIARIQPGGGTEIFPALDAAYEDIRRAPAKKKHVVLLTDGQAPTAGIRDLVQAMVAEGITVSTIGLGGSTDEQMLKMISDVGGGRFYRVMDVTQVPKVIVREVTLGAR
jgi:Mg-chelatase subunit ChlD